MSTSAFPLRRLHDPQSVYSHCPPNVDPLLPSQPPHHFRLVPPLGVLLPTLRFSVPHPPLLLAHDAPTLPQDPRRSEFVLHSEVRGCTDRAEAVTSTLLAVTANDESWQDVILPVALSPSRTSAGRTARTTGAREAREGVGGGSAANCARRRRRRTGVEASEEGEQNALLDRCWTLGEG